MKWNVFISHAGEDKRAVARPLADLLTRAGLRVWLDENELTVGDSLRRKIDQGLAESDYGVVILSRAFFSKDWPQRELDALASLQSSGRKVILPVWHNVDEEFVARHSPLLAGIFAVSTDKGLPSVAEKIVRAIEPAATSTPPSSGRRPGRGVKARPWVIGAVFLILLSAGLVGLYQPTRLFLRQFLTSASSIRSTSPSPAVSRVTLSGTLRVVAAGVGVVSKVVEKGTPPIIIFEENHTSRVGRIEIAIMLNRLYETWGVRQIGQEGVFRQDRPLDCSWFHPSLVSRGALSSRDKVAVRLLAEGEISSGELMCLVYPDFKVHGVEKAVEYNADVSRRQFSDPVIAYLLAIADASMSPDQARRAESLMNNGHEDEALAYVLDSNRFTKHELALLESGILSAANELRQLAVIEAESKRVGARVSAGDQKEFELEKTFWRRTEVRSSTMAATMQELAQKYPTSPIGLITGASHTERIAATLNEANLSFGVVQPESFARQGDPSVLSEAAFDRVSLGQSVDAAGGLGSFLDGRRKPPPVVGKNWLRSKAEAYLLTAMVADVETPAQPYESSSFQKGLLQLQYVELVPSSLELQGTDKIFAMRAQVQNLREPVEVWVRAARIRPESPETLESALTSALHSSQVVPPHSPLHVTDDVIAVFSKSRSAVVESSLPR